jgi:hypothetical protein
MRMQTLAVSAAGITTVAGLILLLDRGGLIAAALLLIGIALLVKARLKPARTDLGLCVGLAAIVASTWIATFQYVISTWESSEVVELAIETGEGTHNARVWVMDIGEHPVVYYDAPPRAAKALLEGKPLQLTRAGEVSTRIPEATEIELLPEDEAIEILEAMEAKYGDRVDAADIYYLMLGRPWDRIALVATLIEM